MVAKQCGVGRSGLPGQLDQALDVGTLVFVDDVVNFRHDLGRLDGSIVEGAAAHLPVRRGGSPDVIPTVDSSLRYANVFKFAVGPVIWSQLRHIEQSPAVSFAAATIAFGGLARLRSWQQRGRPHPITVGAIALETIGVPILLAWQRRLSAKAV